MNRNTPQLCPTLCDSMDYSPPGSSVHGILQARILEWVAIPFSRGSSWPRDQIWVFCIAGRLFTIWVTREDFKCSHCGLQIWFRSKHSLSVKKKNRKLQCKADEAGCWEYKHKILNFENALSYYTHTHTKASWWLSSKESTCNARDTGDLGLIPGSGRSLGEKNGNQLQYSCLENSMYRGDWWATVHGVTKSWTGLSN